MAIRISASGSVSDSVSSEEQITAMLAAFKSLVQESVLIDGRSFELSLTFGAYEVENPELVVEAP